MIELVIGAVCVVAYALIGSITWAATDDAGWDGVRAPPPGIAGAFWPITLFWFVASKTLGKTFRLFPRFGRTVVNGVKKIKAGFEPKRLPGAKVVER